MAIITLIKKDFLCLSRAKGGFVASIIFAFTLVVLASFIFKRIAMTEKDIANTFSALSWLVFAFVSSNAASQLFSFEKEEEALEGLFLSGVKRSSVYLSKFFSLFILILFLQLLVQLNLSLLFNLNIFDNFFELLIITALSSAGFSSIASLLASVSSNLSSKEIALPILLFPLTLGLFVAAAFNTNEVLLNGSLEITNFWFVFLLVYFMLGLCSGLILFEHSIEE